MIYLDHAATTPITYAARTEMEAWMSSFSCGNPNSAHTRGFQAKRAVEIAKKQIASLINASNPDDIYFVSSGTEANTLWKELFGLDIWVLTTKTEHSSNYTLPIRTNSAISKLDVGKDGKVDTKRLREMDLSVFDAVSVIWVNNETGTENPIKEIGRICMDAGKVFHVDATQAVGHVEIDVRKGHIDMMTMSAHKFGGPQGVGVLYVRGGSGNMPSRGTPNVAGIIGTGVAALVAHERLSLRREAWKKSRECFLEQLAKGLGDTFQVNGGNAHSSIISLTFPGVNAESLLIALDADGLYVSARAACATGKDEASHVLTAMGLSEDDARATIRVSMSLDQTPGEMIRAADIITNRVKKLREEGEPFV